MPICKYLRSKNILKLKIKIHTEKGFVDKKKVLFLFLYLNVRVM